MNFEKNGIPSTYISRMECMYLCTYRSEFDIKQKKEKKKRSIRRDHNKSRHVSHVEKDAEKKSVTTLGLF